MRVTFPSMCHVEIQQAVDLFNFKKDMEMYYDSIAKKTAIFFECCCKSGAVVGGANEIHVNVLGQYGLNLGFAFQIIDDILDFCGEAEVV